MSKLKRRRGSPSVVLEETSRGYNAVLGSYNVKINLGEENGGVTPVSAESYLGSEKEASLCGTIVGGGKVAHISTVDLPEDVTRNEDTPAVGVLLVSLEEALRKRGVEVMRTSTHHTFARFLEQLGWVEVGRRGGSIDMDRIIAASAQTKLPDVLKIHELGKRLQ